MSSSAAYLYPNTKPHEICRILGSMGMISDISAVQYTHLTDDLINVPSMLRDPFIDTILLAAFVPEYMITNEKPLETHRSSTLRTVRLLLGEQFQAYTTTTHRLTQRSTGRIIQLAKGCGYFSEDNSETNNSVHCFIVKVTSHSLSRNECLHRLEETLENLTTHKIYTFQIDDTIDIGCSFIKTDVITKMLALYPEYKVIDDDHKVGRDCATFIAPDKSRCKGYNKFSHNLSSATTLSEVGFQVADWVNSQDERFKEAAEVSLPTGYTRIETSTYFTSPVTEIFNKLHNCRSFLDNVLQMLNVFRRSPIETQWCRHCSVLTHTSIIYNQGKRECTIAWWYNSLTGKFGGETSTLTKLQSTHLNLTEFLLSKFMMNVPCLYVLIDNDHKFTANVYERTQPGSTHVLGYHNVGRGIFTHSSREKQPSEQGLIMNMQVRLIIPTGRQYVNTTRLPESTHHLVREIGNDILNELTFIKFSPINNEQNSSPRLTGRELIPPNLRWNTTAGLALQSCKNLEIGTYTILAITNVTYRGNTRHFMYIEELQQVVKSSPQLEDAIRRHNQEIQPVFQIRCVRHHSFQREVQAEFEII
jgi:hypothetical protein